MNMENCAIETKLSASLPKAEKLCSEKETAQLFANGKSFVKYPLRIVYSQPQPSDTDVRCQILTSVPKKRFKRAVKRNRIKRLMREAYRLNKHILTDAIDNGCKMNIAFVYIDTTLPTFANMQKSMVAALSRIAKSITESKTENETA